MYLLLNEKLDITVIEIVLNYGLKQNQLTILDSYSKPYFINLVCALLWCINCIKQHAHRTNILGTLQTIEVLSTFITTSYTLKLFSYNCNVSQRESYLQQVLTLVGHITLVVCVFKNGDVGEIVIFKKWFFFLQSTHNYMQLYNKL
jgi:hypothetical protein